MNTVITSKLWATTETIVKPDAYLTDNAQLHIYKWNTPKEEMCLLQDSICCESIGLNYQSEVTESNSCNEFDSADNGVLNLPFVVNEPAKYNDDGTPANKLTELWLCAERGEPVKYQFVSSGGDIDVGAGILTNHLQLTPKRGIQRWGITLQSADNKKIPCNTPQLTKIQVRPLNGAMPDLQICDIQGVDLIQEAIMNGTYSTNPFPEIDSPCVLRTPTRIKFMYPIGDISAYATTFSVFSFFDTGDIYNLGTYSLAPVTSDATFTAYIDDTYLNEMPDAFNHALMIGMC